MKIPQKPSECKESVTDEAHRFVVWFSATPYAMSFFVCEIAGTEGDKLLFGPVDGPSNLDMVDDPDDARWFLHGWVKRDGCMDVDIGGEGLSYRNHFCGRDDAARVGRMFDFVYDLAARNIEMWRED